MSKGLVDVVRATPHPSSTGPTAKDAVDEAEPQVPRTFPISIKGVIINSDGRVLLLKNEREEWELPGGKLELGETAAECVAREVAEESGWTVSTGPLLDVWMYQPIPDRHVFIVTYGCPVLEAIIPPRVSDEHKEIGLFRADDVPGLVMPEGYKKSIATWFDRHQSGATR